MKLKKENLSNFAFIVLLGLLLFTPLGFHARVFVSRILSFSPSVLHEEEQLVLSDYNWKLVDTKGEAFDLKNVKGKVVLVNFWATWCPPCVAEMPSLQKLYEDYGGKVEFVLVAHDKPEKVEFFLNKKKHDLPVYFETSPGHEVLTTERIPTTFVIGKKGRIVVKKTGAAHWNSMATRELFDHLLEEN